jgi:16S rRNA (uracil1498-N3)-methyltransferase
LRDALAEYRPSEPLALFIGAEGGLSDSELERLAAEGFERVRFGTFTLRTETAATAVLGALVALTDLG